MSLARAVRIAPRGVTAASLFAPARQLATKAETAKALEADVKTLSAALDGVDPSMYSKVLGSPELSGAKEAVKGAPLWAVARAASAPSPSKSPVTVAIAGGSAAATEASFYVASGMMLGGDQPVTLALIGADASVAKELTDCGFPLLAGAKAATSLSGAAYSIVLDGDAGALAKGASGLVGVVGMSAAAAAAKAAPGASVTAITRIAQAAAEAALAAKADVSVDSVEKVCIWGEDAVDLTSATVAGRWAVDVVGDWTPDVSSPDPAVAGAAAVAHMKDWALGSKGKWSSMGVPAVGDYGLGAGFYYSVPVVCTPGEYKRVGGIPISPALATAMEGQRVALS